MFEQITRPFARPGLLVTGRLVPSRQHKTVDPVVVLWGASGAVPTVVEDPTPGAQDPANLHGCDTSNTEGAGRITEDVDVKNKDDPSQFITVRRIKHINFYRTEPGIPGESVVSYSLRNSLATPLFDTKMGVDIGGHKCKSGYDIKWTEVDQTNI